MEWFRKEDGTVAIGEVAARPPGVSVMPLINRAHDIDFFTGWCRLMIHHEFEPPRERKYAAGCAFLRGLGAGRVVAVHGLDKVKHDLGDSTPERGGRARKYFRVEPAGRAGLRESREVLDIMWDGVSI